MARKNVTICDRCGRECEDRFGRHQKFSASYEGKDYDLCPSCNSALHSWLSKDNVTAPGDSVEWEERCGCNIPCAGPCGSGGWHKRGRR